MPTIHRYLEWEYIDRFFATGELRLSTFQSCRILENPVYADPGEGSGLIAARQGPHRLPAGNIGIGGVNAYVLCASTEGSDSMMNHFGRDSHITIHDPAKLLRDVAVALGAVCVNAFEGACVYQETRSIQRDTNQPLFFQPDAKERDNDGNQLFGEQELVDFSDEISRRVQAFAFQDSNLDFFLVKPLRFVEDKEYRLVWLVNDATIEPTSVYCPDVSDYCTAIARTS